MRFSQLRLVEVKEDVLISQVGKENDLASGGAFPLPAREGDAVAFQPRIETNIRKTEANREGRNSALVVGF